MVLARRVAMVSHILKGMDDVKASWIPNDAKRWYKRMMDVKSSNTVTGSVGVVNTTKKPRTSKVISRNGRIISVPKDIWIKIMTYFDGNSLCHIMSSCHWLSRMARNQDHLWRDHIETLSKDEWSYAWYAPSLRQYYLQRAAMRNKHADIYLTGYGVETSRPVRLVLSIQKVGRQVHPGNVILISFVINMSPMTDVCLIALDRDSRL
jgi:hypothetical protein